MKAEYLGSVGYCKGEKRQAFYVGIQGGCDYIKSLDKDIVLFGVGENACAVEMMLNINGIAIDYYVDNSEKLHGTKLRGKKIYSPYEIFQRKDVFIIIAVTNENINYVRLQLMTHNITDYGMVLVTRYHDFCEEDVQIQETLMEAINEICFEDETVESALPYMGLHLGLDGSKLGDLNWLLKSTTMSHWTYLWENNFLKKRENASVLEIGPGFGLMSLVLLKLFDNIKIDWCLLGEDNDRLDLHKNEGYPKGLKKCKKKYDSRIKEIWGQIERSKFKLNQEYDLIICTEVFEHFVLNPLPTLQKMREALNDDGVLILTTPNWGHLHIYDSWREMPGAETVSNDRYWQLTKCGHTYQYTREELMEIIELSGLEVIDYKIADSNAHNFILKKINHK
jgi:2-polyprenyl-3-methyl-5-hydroxy-6-metoxy-1,4-benzoquinol methylase